MPDAEADAVHAACFPMLPFANRIANASLQVGHRVARMSAAIPERHGLHGTGWRSRWTVEHCGAQSIDMMLCGGGDPSWPWRWRGAQQVRIDAGGLTVALTLRNEDPAPAPASLGLHPAFVLPEHAAVALDADGIWDCDTSLIPCRWRPASWASLHDGALDNCLTGWSGQARIRRPDGIEVTLVADTDLLQVYRPEGAGTICLEPVTARPNAWAVVRGVDGEQPPLLAPGGVQSVTMRISAKGGDAG